MKYDDLPTIPTAWLDGNIDKIHKIRVSAVESVVWSIVRNETRCDTIEMTDLRALAQRCLWQYYPDHSQILLVDGNPVLKLFPPEFEMVPSETGHTYKMTQRYERLLQNKDPTPT